MVLTRLSSLHWVDHDLKIAELACYVENIFAESFVLINFGQKIMPMKEDYNWLKDREFLQKFGWGKAVNFLAKLSNQWALEKLKHMGFKDIKIAYVPVIFNVNDEGANNCDLARRTQVTKQAMSQCTNPL